MSGSPVPAAVDGLLAYWAAAPSLTGVDIRDALTAPDEQASAAIMVGWQDPTGVSSANAVDTAADFTATSEGLGTRTRQRFTIHCAAAALDGNGDYGLARRAAYSLASLADAALAADRTIGGAIQGEAITGAGSLRYELIPDVGIKALVLFDVVADAYTT